MNLQKGLFFVLLCAALNACFLEGRRDVESTCGSDSECPTGLRCERTCHESGLDNCSDEQRAFVFLCVCPGPSPLTLARDLDGCEERPDGGDPAPNDGAGEGGVGGTTTPPACVSAADCTEPAAPICGGTGTCEPCLGNEICRQTDPATPLCEPDSGACVACLASTECTDPNAPICSGGSCVPCTANAACSARDQTRPVCLSGGSCGECSSDAFCSGATPACDLSTHRCVACQTNDHCSGATPICENSVCRACGADSECVGQGSGVCMRHEDGRCATTAETVVVSGTVQDAVDTALEDGKTLVVVPSGTYEGGVVLDASDPQRRLSLIGRGAANTTLKQPGGFAVTVKDASVFVRALTLADSAIGISTEAGATLTMQSAALSSNSQAGLISGGTAVFDNVQLADNGAGIICTVGFTFNGQSVAPPTCVPQL